MSWGVLGVVYQNIFCSLNFFWNDVDWNAGEDDRAEVAHIECLFLAWFYWLFSVGG